METKQYVCACGAVVERKATWLREVSCFNCKQGRKRVYANLYKSGGYVPDPARIELRAERAKKTAELMARRKELAALTQKQIDERNEKIIEMRIAGSTLEEIAAELTPKITRERVRQILKTLEVKHGVNIPIPDRKYERHETTCKFCGQPKAVAKSQYLGEGKHYHRGCFKSKFLRPDGTKMDKNEISRYRYNNMPGRKEKHKVFAARYIAKLKADPEKWKRHIKLQNEYSKKWLAEKRKDPEWLAKQRARTRAHWEAIKADPVKYNKYLEQQARRAARRKALSTGQPLPPKAT